MANGVELDADLGLGRVRFVESKLRRHLYATNKPIVISKGIADGERDIVDLVLDERPAAWLYSHDRAAWYNAYAGPFQTVSVPIDYSQFGRRVSRYDIHHWAPSWVRLELEKQVKQPELQKRKRDLAVGMAELFNAFPSSDEVTFAIQSLRKSPNCDMDFKVASAMGIIDMKVAQTEGEPELVAQKYVKGFESLKISVDLETGSYEKIAQDMIGEVVSFYNQRSGPVRLGFRPVEMHWLRSPL